LHWSFHCICTGEKEDASKKGEDAQSFAKVENEAHPDMATWNRYLNQQAKLPDSVAKEIPPGCYTVVVTFIIDIYGGITEVKAEKDPGYGLGSMAVKAIRNYKGKWNPASQCGNLVKAYKKQPITYTIEAE
jgi:periplasmic protein TonB